LKNDFAIYYFAELERKRGEPIRYDYLWEVVLVVANQYAGKNCRYPACFRRCCNHKLKCNYSSTENERLQPMLLRLLKSLSQTFANVVLTHYNFVWFHEELGFLNH
jgi:hypothetical protein